MKYVLLLIFTSAGNNITTTMHDFDSKESCVAALREVRQAHKEYDEIYAGIRLRKSICMPK